MPKKPEARKGAGKTKGHGRSKREIAEKTQSERFIEAARAVGVDESGEEFERAVKRLVPERTKRRP